MDLSVTNAWLAVGAISLLVIALAVMTALVVLIRVGRNVVDAPARASAAIELVSQHVTPLAEQTTAFLGDAHDLVQQLRHTNTTTTAAVERIADRWRRVTTAARSGLWPALAAARGAAAGVQGLGGGPLHGRGTGGA